jgi:hypothetical protein
MYGIGLKQITRKLVPLEKRRRHGAKTSSQKNQSPQFPSSSRPGIAPSIPEIHRIILPVQLATLRTTPADESRSTIHNPGGRGRLLHIDVKAQTIELACFAARCRASGTRNALGSANALHGGPGRVTLVMETTSGRRTTHVVHARLSKPSGFATP